MFSFISADSIVTGLLPSPRVTSSQKLNAVQLKFHFQNGVQYVTLMRDAWLSLESKIDSQRFEEVQTRLNMQRQNAAQSRDTCLKYFGSFAKSPWRCRPQTIFMILLKEYGDAT